MRASSRAARWAAGLTTVVVPLTVAGCSFQSSEERAAEQVVTTFFDRLVDGDATGAGELLSDPSVVSPVALDDAVYAEAVRPVEARVTSVTGSGPESSVDVEYRLDGEEEARTLVVSTETVGGEPRVALWSDHGLPVVHPGVPVEIVVEGSGAFDLATSGPLRLLPGIYDLELAGPQDLTTIDPDGGDSEPFTVEFPVDPDAIQPPPGAELRSQMLHVDPVLRAEVATEAEARIDELLASCTAAGLTGDACPQSVADGIFRGYAGVDVASAVWAQAEPLSLVAGEEVRASAPYTVSARWPQGPLEVTVRVEGTVLRDPSGAVVVELA